MSLSPSRHIGRCVAGRTRWAGLRRIWAQLIDRLVRERALRESTSRRFEEERQDAWRIWPQEKPEEDGEYIVQIEGAAQATTLWYQREAQEWYEEWYELSGRYEEREAYRITKWQPLPEV